MTDKERIKILLRLIELEALLARAAAEMAAIRKLIDDASPVRLRA